MADIKRLHYFDQQFLVEADFREEQEYHIDMRRRHNMAMHTPGIADGLGVTKTANTTKSITVAAGTAIDREGRELVLEVSQPLDLDAAKFPPNGKVCVTISHKEVPSDFLDNDPTKFRRTLEKGVVKADSEEPPDNSSDVLLASFSMGADGNVPADTLITSGPRAGKGTVIEGLTGKIALVPGGGINIVTNPQANNITLSAMGLAGIDGVSNPGGNVDLMSANSIQITPDNVNKRIVIGDNHSTIVAGNPHGTTSAMIGALTSVDGVSNPGGNVDLMPANSIQITPDNVNKRIVIGDNHSTIVAGNPHGTTSAMIGALTSVDGVSNPGGNVDLMSANSIQISADNVNKRITIGDNHSTIVAGNPHGTTPAMIGALAASQYDLGKRVLATLKFTNADTLPSNITDRTVPTSFQPKLVLIIGIVKATLSGTFYGGPISGFYDAATGIQQWVGYVLVRLSNLELASHSNNGNICHNTFQNLLPGNFLQEESYDVTILGATATGLNTRLTRLGAIPFPFEITMQMLCMG